MQLLYLTICLDVGRWTRAVSANHSTALGSMYRHLESTSGSYGVMQGAASACIYDLL